MARNARAQKTGSATNKLTGPSGDSEAKKTKSMEELLGVPAMEFGNVITDEDEVICEVQISQMIQRVFSGWLSMMQMHSSAEKQKQSSRVQMADRIVRNQEPLPILHFDDPKVSSFQSNTIDALNVEKIKIDVDDVQSEIDF